MLFLRSLVISRVKVQLQLLVSSTEVGKTLMENNSGHEVMQSQPLVLRRNKLENTSDIKNSLIQKALMKRVIFNLV